MAPIRHAISRVMRSLVMKFTLLCGVILVVATTALMAVEYQLKAQDNKAAGLVHAELITELFTTTAANAIAVSDMEGLTNRLLTDFGERQSPRHRLLWRRAL